MSNVPTHVAIIMDGNRRWAKAQGKKSVDGHKKGLENLTNLSEHIFKSGVKVLSVYAFSTENFNRSEEEISYIMKMFVNNIGKVVKKLKENNIKIVFSGRKTGLSDDVIEKIQELEEISKNNTAAIFNVCFNYGGQAEIVDATKKIIENNISSDNITIEMFGSYLYNDLPQVDLMLRPGGEQRLSNFLLWQNSYAEFYFTDILFPDFNEVEYDKALSAYQERNRRFGGNIK